MKRNIGNRIIHISMSNINFDCPHCGEKYQDKDDKYLDKCNKNKSGITSIRCRCGEKFGMTYDMMGHAIGFKL